MNFADKVREQTAEALRIRDLEEERERLKSKAEFDRGFEDGETSALNSLPDLRKKIEEIAQRGETSHNINTGERDSEVPSSYNEGFMNGKHKKLTELLKQDGFDVKADNHSGAYKYDSDCNPTAWYCQMGLSVSWGAKT